MTKQLQFIPFLFLVLTTLNVNAQELIDDLEHIHDVQEVVSTVAQSAVENVDFIEMKDFSYDYKVQQDRDGQNDLAGLHEIISSDEKANFNCSAGFCMNRKHHHKKGLTRNRQLFNYFLNIDG